MVEAQVKVPDSKEPVPSSTNSANMAAPGESAPRSKPKKEKKDGGGKRNKKVKKDVLKALTKVVIRRLPPSMDEETFRKQIDPIPDHDDFYFVSGDWSLGKNASSRAYINFTRAEDIYLFKDKFDGYIFVDAKGVDYPAVVEFAPFQELPRNRSRKKDAKSGTIETDTHFIAFKEALEAEEKECAGKSKSKLEYSYQIKDEKKITSTPLLEFIAQKKQEKREEKRRKMEEKKKQRKEERLKKTQTGKPVPDSIKEEKVQDDDDIVVRTVPSRLDPNQGKKDNIKKANDKTEGLKDIKDKDKKQRNRKEKDKERVRNEKSEMVFDQDKGMNRKQERDRQRKDKDKFRKLEEKEKKFQTDLPRKDKELPMRQESVDQKPSTAPKKEVKKYSERRKETRARAENRLAELEERKDSPITIEHFKTIPNIPKVDIKKSLLTPHVAPFIPKEKPSTIILGESSFSLPPAFPQKSTTPTLLPDERKESTPAPDTPTGADSSSSEKKLEVDEKIKEAREARKIRNKDRPSIEIYQPRKRLISGNAAAAGPSKEGVKSEDDKNKDKSDSEHSSDKSLKPSASGHKDKDRRHKLTKKASDKERPRDRRNRRKNSSDIEGGEKEKKNAAKKVTREEMPPPPAEPAPASEKIASDVMEEIADTLEGVKLES